MALPRAFHSLGVRLVVPLFATTAVVLAVYALLGFRSSREHLLRLVQADLDRSGGLIKRATHDRMLNRVKPTYEVPGGYRPDRFCPSLRANRTIAWNLGAFEVSSS